MEYKKDSWDLEDIRPKNIDATYKKLEDLTSEIETYKKSFKDISRKDFHKMVELNDELDVLVYRMSVAIHLKFSENTADPNVNQEMAKLDLFTTGLCNRLLFFSQGIKNMSKKRLDYLIEGLSEDDKYSFKESWKKRKHQLPMNIQEIVNLKDLTGTVAMKKIYDKLTSKFKFSWVIDGKRQQISESKLVSFFKDEDRKTREEAYRKQHKKYEDFAGVIGDIYISLVKDWGNMAKKRKYKSPINKRNKSNEISDKIIENLLESTKSNRFLFQEYFKIKKHLCGIKGKMKRTDVYAPVKLEIDQKFPFEEAVKMVLDAFDSFSPEYKEMAEKMFSKRHVYSIESENKRGGAFCMGVPPGYLPYVFMNYYDRLDDVSTLAHELGHAIHDQLALVEHSLSTYHPSLPLAETASIFAERLLSEKLFRETNDKEIKKALLVESLDGSFATVLRQTYFVKFEKDAHDLINSSEGTNVEKLSELYLENLREQFGDSLHVQDHFKNEWLRIPHIFRSPFYCYAYSFGNLLTLALYEEYKEQGKAFVPKHKRILAAGGSDSPYNILKKEGIDLNQESFWQKGFDVLRKDLENLEKLI